MRHWLVGTMVASLSAWLGMAPAVAAPTEPPEASSANSEDAPLPPPLPRKRRMKWGAEFRLEGAPMGSGAASNAGMGGFGMSLRPRPTPHFAVDIGVDFVGGRDFNGETRFEQALIATPMVFVNPQNRVTVYFLAGLGLSSARVEHADGSLSRYSYIGFSGGAGLELRFWPRVALNVDLLAFVRDHTDREVDRYPEFFDPTTGRTTNTSSGALARVGVAYYW